MRKTIFVPPGGFAGFAQQTVAVQALVKRPATRRKTTRKKSTDAPPQGRKETRPGAKTFPREKKSVL